VLQTTYSVYVDKAELERDAKRVRRLVYDRRGEFWPDREPHPFELVQPDIAAQALGFTVEAHEQFSVIIGARTYEAAGALDRESKSVVVATRFGEQVTRFTLAHELGHIVRHRDQVHFRDIHPIAGLERRVTEPKEREADHFAALYLLPPHFVGRLFAEFFLTGGKPFVFNEVTVDLLGRDDRDELLYPEKGSRIRERALASARKFNGRVFNKPLHAMLGVSIETMAIRLEELELIRPWP
jgi:hypothetical protein